MNQQSLFALLISIGIHLLLLYVFHFPPTTTESADIETVEIVIQEMVNPNSTNEAKPFAKKAKRGAGSLSWGKLKPKHHTLENGFLASNGGRDFGHNEDTSGWSENDWGRKATDLKQIENYLTFERIFLHIQGMLNYPPGLGRRKISGNVTARLAFQDHTRCDDSKSFVRGGHPYLRVYIASLLKKYCQILKESDLQLNAQKTIDLTFAFVLTTEVESFIEQKSYDGVLGNVFRYYRSYPAPVTEYRIGPIRGVFGMPMVFLDQEWVFEKWDLWVNEIDIMDRYRERD